MLFKRLLSLFLIQFSLVILGVQVAEAATAKQINFDTEQVLLDLEHEVLSSNEIIEAAKGVLVFPSLWKAGFGLGGEYDEGALYMGGQVVDYFSIVGASVGFQFGVQKQKVIMAFMDSKVLERFRNSDGWEFGLDASAAIVKVGLDGRMDSVSYNEPIVVFVIGQKGLMYNLNLEGYKITRLKK